VAPFFLIWPLWQKGWLNALHVLAGFTATAAWVVSPWLLRTPEAWVAFAALASITLLLAVRYNLPHRGTWLAGILGAAAFVIGAFAGGSFAWFEIGFQYGTKHYPYLFISSCYNLPSLLSKLGWSLKDPFCSVRFGLVDLHLTLQWTLRLIYLGALTLCAYGAARQVRATAHSWVGIVSREPPGLQTASMGKGSRARRRASCECPNANFAPCR